MIISESRERYEVIKSYLEQSKILFLWFIIHAIKTVIIYNIYLMCLILLL